MVSAADLLATSKTTDIDLGLGGKTMRLTYKPGAITGTRDDAIVVTYDEETGERIEEAISDSDTEAMARSVCAIVTDWEFTAAADGGRTGAPGRRRRAGGGAGAARPRQGQVRPGADPGGAGAGDHARLGAGPYEAEVIAWAVLNPAVYEVEVAAGRMAPLPPYVGLLAIREKLGCSLAELAGMPTYWLGAAANVLRAEQLIREARSGKGK